MIDLRRIYRLVTRADELDTLRADLAAVTQRAEDAMDAADRATREAEELRWGVDDLSAAMAEAERRAECAERAAEDAGGL